MKKPDVKTFTEAMSWADGILSDAAKYLGVSRQAVHKWINTDKRFKEVYENQRGKTLDSLVRTAVSLARGIPRLKDGKRIGWKEEPNPKVLTYLIGKLGVKEGFGEVIETRTEITGKNGAPFFQVDMSNEQLEEAIKRIEKSLNS